MIVCCPSKEQHLLSLALPGITSAWNGANRTLRLGEVLVLQISTLLFLKQDLVLAFPAFPVVAVLSHSNASAVFSLPAWPVSAGGLFQCSPLR